MISLPPIDELQKWPGRNVLAYAVYWGRALAARYQQTHDARVTSGKQEAWTEDQRSEHKALWALVEMADALLKHGTEAGEQKKKPSLAFLDAVGAARDSLVLESAYRWRVKDGDLAPEPQEDSDAAA